MDSKLHQTVTSLTNKNKKGGNLIKVSKKAKERFAINLFKFISGITENEKERKELLKIATMEFKNAPLDNINLNCKKCYGRGFISFNRTYKYFTPCKKCFKL